jgi:chemotaxis protein MotA
MDPMTLVGVLLGILAIVAATVMDGNSFGALIGPSSLVLVSVGTLGITMAGYQMSDVLRVPKAAVAALTSKVTGSADLVKTMVECSEIARKEGVLALEPKLETIDDEFLKMGLQQVVDGLDADAVRDVLDIEIAGLDERHRTMFGFFKAAGGYAPTMGMVGTVIGLINMLGNLSDPAELGLGLSVALLTTLYGVLFANLVFMPLSLKLQRLHEVEMSAMEMVVDGVLAIQAGAGPRMLAERLRSFLPPAERAEVQVGTRSSGAIQAEAA